MSPRHDDEDDEPVVIEGVECIHATERAIRVVLGGGRTLWVPQACVTDDSEVYAVGHRGRRKPGTTPST